MSNEDAAMGDGTIDVEWRRQSAGTAPSPLVRRLPYVECKLEHPDVEPTGLADRFFPDAVPYELAGSERVFYWRPALADERDSGKNDPYGNDSDERDPGEDWRAACATTDSLVGLGALPSSAPQLTSEHDDGVSLVVDGTIGGDTTTVVVRSYAPPRIEIAAVTESAVDLRVEGVRERIAVGERRRISLDERTVEPVEGDAGPTRTTPELVVRYPGRRELHHPAPGASYRLFPSFGLDLASLAQPLAVPTAAGELDDRALADRLDIDLAARPYPERVLWRAFANTAFDPYAERPPELAQLRTGHVVPSNRPKTGRRSAEKRP